jgi:N utilization substance protein B
LSQQRTNSRRAAVQAIYQWQMTDGDIDDIEEQFLTEHDTDGMDRSYFHELLHQIPLHLHELEDHFVTILDRPVVEVDPVELAILRIGTYELEFRADIPYKVVINEAVELAKVFGAEDGYKYVNSILDKVAGKLRADETVSTSKRRSSRKRSSASK